jgi:hypothetical protein
VLLSFLSGDGLVFNLVVGFAAVLFVQFYFVLAVLVW